MPNHDLLHLLEIARKTVTEADADAIINPSAPEIQVVIVEPMKSPFKMIIPNTLEAFNKIVGGYIENVFVGQTKSGARVGIILNEEGKIHGLPFNRKIIEFDTLVGTFFITAYNLQGENISLSDEESEYYIERFRDLEVYL
jgi:hypothetical protein